VKKSVQSVALMGLLVSSVVLANNLSYFYGSMGAGIFTGTFDQLYAYQSPSVPNPQNITNTAYQRGYIAALGLGYHRAARRHYFYGADVTGNFDSGKALYESGASGPFTDKTWIAGHVDFSFVPGIALSRSVSMYVKMGLSLAMMRDRLLSYTGTSNTATNYNSDKTIVGFAGGVGISKSVTKRVDVFTEANYHDFGNESLHAFQVQTANYAGSVKINWYDAVVGAAYHFA